MSSSKKNELTSLILNIVTAAIMVFATIFMIVFIVNCKKALSGVTDSDMILSIRKQYGIPCIFVGMACFAVCLIVNMASALIYSNVSGLSEKRDAIAIFKFLYIFVPMVLYIILIIIYNVACK